MAPGHLLAKNTLLHLAGQIFSKGCLLLFYIFLTRRMSVESFGQFNFIISYVTLFAIPADFGLDIILTKRVSVGAVSSPTLTQLFRFKLAWTGAVTLLFVAASLFFLEKDLIVPGLLAGAGYFLFSLTSFTYGVYRGQERLDCEMWCNVLHKTLFVVPAILGLAIADFLAPGFSHHLVLVFACLVFASVLVLVFSLTMIRKLFVFLHEKAAGTSSSWIFPMMKKEAFPLMLVSLFTFVYFRIDTIMIKLLKGDFEVGQYSAAYTLMEGLMFIPGSFMIAFFPRLAKATANTSAFLGQVRLGGSILFAMALVICGGLYLFSDILVALVWGAGYLPSASTLKLLALALFVIHLNYLVTQSAIALNRERFYIKVTAGSAVMNIALNLAFIPLWGGNGAAVSTIITELMMGVVLGYTLLKTVQLPK
ncbi:MAG: flippase [Pseudomonadota bacterium]